MAATVIPMPKFMAFSDAGAPLSAGLVYTYAAGTTTPLATYSDSDLTTPNANPVVLDSAGRATIYLTASSYKIVLKNSAGATVYTQDNIIAAAPYNVDLDVPIVAGEVLTAGQAIYLSDGTGSRTAGRWYLTDSDTAAYSTTVITGFVTTALALGEEGSVRLLGQATVPGPLSVGLTYYLSGTPGAIGTTAGTFVKNMGMADSTTTLIMTVATPVTPGGSNTQVQFNDSGVLGGDSGFTFIKATDAVAIAGATTVGGTLGVTGATTLSSTVATGALTVTGAATVSTTLGVTGAITSATSVALTGTTNNVGTITTGVWNAGAVTSSGVITSTAANGLVTATTGGSSATAFVDSSASGNGISARYRTSSKTSVGVTNDWYVGTNIVSSDNRMEWYSTATVMSLTTAGVLTVSGFGTHSFSAGGTGGNTIRATNTTSGAENYAEIGCIAGNVLGIVRVFSQGYTTGSWDVQGSTTTYADGAGGIGLVANNASGAIRFYSGGTTVRMTLAANGDLTVGQLFVDNAFGGAKIGLPTGGTQGTGTLNVAGNLYKNANAYTNPDYVFEHWATGRVVQFAANDGAQEYTGLLPLASVEAAARTQFALPRIAEARTRNAGRLGVFDGGDAVLASIEEAYLYLFQHDATIAQLAARIAALETKDH